MAGSGVASISAGCASRRGRGLGPAEAVLDEHDVAGTALRSLWSDRAMTMTRSPKTSRWMRALGWFGRHPGRREWPARAARDVILVGVSASLTLGSGAAVAQSTDQPGLPVKALAKSCNLGFMPTKPTVTVPSILGNDWAVCDVPPERHDNSIERSVTADDCDRRSR
jgi:hypothetical protein